MVNSFLVEKSVTSLPSYHDICPSKMNLFANDVFFLNGYPPEVPPSVPLYLPACLLTYLRTYVPTYLRTYVPTYLRTYVPPTYLPLIYLVQPTAQLIYKLTLYIPSALGLHHHHPSRCRGLQKHGATTRGYQGSGRTAHRNKVGTVSS